MKEELKEKITQLQLLEQRMQANAQQKQQLQARLLEIESATSELDNKEESYKIIGTVMVKVQPENLKKELTDKKEVLNIRLESINKQEDKIKEQAESLQKQVQDAMKGGENG